MNVYSYSDVSKNVEVDKASSGMRSSLLLIYGFLNSKKILNMK